jgi:serine/threonine protein kinase
MNAESKKMRESLVDQLSSFEARLDSKVDDVRMLADIQDGLGHLLGAGGGSEAEVRRVLQERYEGGNLRKETFQLVKSMLDRYVSEQGPGLKAKAKPVNGTSPPRAAAPGYVQTIADAARELQVEQHPLSRTVVLPAQTRVEPATADDRVQIGSVLRDRFLLQERVAGGSMGVVYKALDRRLAEAGTANPYVAIKVLSPDLAENGQALRALQQEAAKGRCLSHPNIVRFLDLDRDEDLYFIVMEWLDGRTLANILDAPETAKLSRKQAFEIVEQIGKALVYAHRCGIVHADIKPGNVMIMPNGDAKLFDFGVARVRQKQVEERQAFDPGVMGLLTPAYSSMQVLTGEDPTPSDDVFALACLLYRLIAGYRVFGPRNAAEAAAEGMKPQCPQGLSDARWRVLKKALAYSRVARFDSVSEFIEALNVGVDEPIPLIAPIREDLNLHDDSHGPGRFIIGVLVLLGLLAGAGYQYGLLDDVVERIRPGASSVVSLPPLEDNAVAPAETIVATTGSADEEPASAVSVDEAAAIPDPVAVEPVDDLPVAASEIMPADTVLEVAPVLVDFSLLPPPTIELRIGKGAAQAAASAITMREGRAPVIIDFVRDYTNAPLTLRLEEIGFTGNRSPWLAGEYTVRDGEFVEFPVGQARARITLAMRSDPLREADQQSTLRLREADNASAEFATVTVYLEDDDQRAFEATLPVNTVAFAVSQISVQERDPAVQIDILRFNPDDTRLVVAYFLRDITATQGEDYFAPGSYTIEFGPNQRSARLLIPLVQDFVFEDNEAFSIELATADSVADMDVYQRTAVIIRDDDS